MNPNEELVNKFYTAFQKLDFETMNSCYSEDIAFYDPAFGLLRGNVGDAVQECQRFFPHLWQYHSPG